MNRQEADKLIKENERLKNEIKEIENRVISTKINTKNPLFTLSIEEFVTIIEKTLGNYSGQPTTKNNDFTEKKTVYGIAGIAQLFGCCRTTASRILHSGKIDKAVTRWGQKIIIDAELALELNKQ